jgi:hypothetical protein
VTYTITDNFAPTFAAKTDFTTGSQPQAVALADLNADGRKDLVIANAGSSTVSVLLGNGNGTFGVKTDFGVASASRSVAIADLNGDGRPDLVATATYSVWVLLGNGDGTFGVKTDFDTGSSAYDVAIGDLNADARLDLAVANSASNSVSVLLGNGNGTFGAKTAFLAGVGDVHSVAIADLNADGRPDLATTNQYYSMVSVLLGNGNDTFGTNAEFITGVNPIGAAIGDLNGDGRPDLVVTNYGSQTLPSTTVSVLLGNGNGTFGAKTDFGTGINPNSVAIADLNADGRRDLAVTNGGANTVSVLLGNGDGTFGAKADFGTGIYPASVAIADLNADGRPDLAVASAQSNAVSVLLGKGDGIPGPGPTSAPGAAPVSVAIADLNADGRPDLARRTTVRVRSRCCSATATARSGSRPTSAPGSILRGGDRGSQRGRPAGPGDGELRLQRCVGAAREWNGTVGAKPFGAGFAPGSLASRTSMRTGPTWRWRAAARIRSRCCSAGTARAQGCLRRPSYGGSVVIADLNADGRRELAATNGGANTVSVRSTVAIHGRCEGELPVMLRVSLAMPNPTRNRVFVRLDLPTPTSVRANVFDVTGRLVRRVADGFYEAGVHTLTWDGTRSDAGHVAPGLYFCRITAAGREFSRTIVRIP